MSLTDAVKYVESWDEAAKYFQKAVSKDDWEKAMKGVRKPLGSVESRKLKSGQYSHSLSGAPDSDDVVIQYETSFENKKAATETITPMLEKGPGWRVAGYYIK